LNAGLARSRLSSTLEQHPEWEAESQVFLRNYFLLLTIPPLFLGLLQFAGGYNNPFYIFSNDLNVYVVLSWCVLFLTWTRFFHWMVFQNGAQTLVKFREVGINMPRSESMVKVWVLLMLAAGVCALAVGAALDLGGTASQIFVGQE
jgi:hypothetical protein